MKEDIKIKTDDGIVAASIFRSSTAHEGPQRGVLFYMDAMGPRQSLHDMAQRLADEGYIVLVPDLFYRFAPYGPFTGTAFSDPAAREQILKMLGGTTQDMTKRDTAAFINALTEAGAAGPFGAVGYCMGGGRALTAAGSYPDRIAAAASFHGGNLATDDPSSPHLLAKSIKARVYIGMAGVDGSFPPVQSTRLAEALRLAEVDHIIENYVGSGHGWAVPDHGTYAEPAGERHWQRLLTLFRETLA